MTTSKQAWTPKTEGQRILDSAYRYLINPMTEFRVPAYLRGAIRWNSTCDALKVVAVARAQAGVL